MSISSGEGSPVCSPPGPESVACYEECTTDETFNIPTSPPLAAGAPVDEEPSSLQPVLGSGGSVSHGVPKSTSSGRITKRGSSVSMGTQLAYTHTLAGAQLIRFSYSYS